MSASAPKCVGSEHENTTLPIHALSSALKNWISIVYGLSEVSKFLHWCINALLDKTMFLWFSFIFSQINENLKGLGVKPPCLERMIDKIYSPRTIILDDICIITYQSFAEGEHIRSIYNCKYRFKIFFQPTSVGEIKSEINPTNLANLQLCRSFWKCSKWPEFLKFHFFCRLASEHEEYVFVVVSIRLRNRRKYLKLVFSKSKCKIAVPIRFWRIYIEVSRYPKANSYDFCIMWYIII